MKMDVESPVECQPKTNDQDLEKLRSKHRTEKQAYREHQREFILNRARFLGDEEKSDLSNFGVSTLGKYLKTKSQVSCELLTAIKNKLRDGEENVEAFLNVDGALESLLRILSGQNEKFQLIAAHCISYLALGKPKESFRVLKASVSYLTAHLSGRNCYIKEACLAALGNFSRHGPKCIKLLMDQGVLSKLVTLLSQSDANLEPSAVYALTQLIYHGFDILETEGLKTTLVASIPILKTRSFSVAFLLSVLSSSPQVHPLFINHKIHMDVLNCLIVALKENEKESVFYIRILSNLIAEESGEVGKNLIESNCNTIRECVRYLLTVNQEYLKIECLDFLGNLVNHSVQMCHLFGVELLKENFEMAVELIKRLKENRE